MGNYIFTREEEENQIQKRAILDKKIKNSMNIIYCGLLIVGSFIGICFTGGMIFLIDGGITLTYIITNIAMDFLRLLSLKMVLVLLMRLRLTMLNNLKSMQSK